MPIGPHELLLIVVLPALLALVCLALAWRVWRADYRFGQWGGPVAFSLGFMVAYPAIVGGWPAFPPREATSWLFIIAFAAGGAGLLDALLRLPVAARIGLIFVLTFVCAAAVLRFKLVGSWSIGQSITTLTALGILGVIWWAAFERSAGDGGVTAPLLMWIASVTTSVALMMTGGIKFGLFGAALAGIGGAMLVLVLVRRSVTFARGSAMTFVPLLSCVIVAAHFLIPIDGKHTITVTLPLLATPVFIGLGRLIPASRWRPWQRVLVRVAALAVPMTVVLILAAIEFRQSQDNASDPYSENAGVIPLHPLGAQSSGQT